jgi:hypothetical protein
MTGALCVCCVYIWSIINSKSTTRDAERARLLYTGKFLLKQKVLNAYLHNYTLVSILTILLHVRTCLTREFLTLYICICTCVCMYVCLYVCMYVYMYMYTYIVCMYLCMHVYVYILKGVVKRDRDLLRIQVFIMHACACVICYMVSMYLYIYIIYIIYDILYISYILYIEC